LVDRKYLLKQKKSLIASETAHQLMASLPGIITSPGMTAVWEQELDKIAERKTTLASFMQKQTQFIEKLVADAGKMTISVTGNTPKCPECNGYMRKIKGRHGVFWGCLSYPKCKGVYTK